MGIKSFLFGGGFGPDQPRHRQQSETMQMLGQYGMMLAENPQFADYFSTANGQRALQAMDLGGIPVEQAVEYIKSFAPKLPSSQAYQDISEQFGGQAAKAEGDYGALDTQLMDLYNQMGGMSGDLSDYYGGGDVYANQRLQNIPAEAYGGMQTMQEEAANRAYKKALQGAGSAMASRGFGRGSGIAGGARSALGRALMEQYTNIGRDVGMQKAQGQLDFEKYLANMAESQRQYRSGYMTDLQKFQKNFGAQQQQQQAGLLGQRAQNVGNKYQTMGQALGNQLTAYGAQTERAMAPYMMPQQYYGQTANIQYQKPGALGQIMGAAGGIMGGIGSMMK